LSLPNVVEERVTAFPWKISENVRLFRRDFAFNTQQTHWYRRSETPSPWTAANTPLSPLTESAVVASRGARKRFCCKRHAVCELEMFSRHLGCWLRGKYNTVDGRILPYVQREGERVYCKTATKRRRRVMKRGKTPGSQLGFPASEEQGKLQGEQNGGRGGEDEERRGVQLES